MRKLFIIITALFALSSCDIVDFDVDYGEFPECEMELDRHQVYVMVGDTFSVHPIFTPDTLPNREVFYYSEPEGLLSFDSERFTAVTAGNTWLYAISVKQRLQDSCRVSVMQPWIYDEESQDYPYDMVIYANVTLNGKAFDPETMTLAAFVDGECRGIGVMRQARGIDYMELRIGSEVGTINIIPDDDDVEDGGYEIASEKVVLRLYDKSELMCYTFRRRVTFDEETHGTLSDLYKLDF